MDTVHKHKWCGFKKPDGFVIQVEWLVDEVRRVRVLGKCTGRVTSRNMYPFPPPLDHVPLFGGVAIVLCDVEGNALPLSLERWNTFRQMLLTQVYLHTPVPKNKSSTYKKNPKVQAELHHVATTSEGYWKDGFVVDGEGGEEGGEGAEGEREEEELMALSDSETELSEELYPGTHG